MEQLQKQLEEHITHNNDQESVFNNNSTPCASVISSKSVGSQSTIAASISSVCSEKVGSRNAKRMVRALQDRRMENIEESQDITTEDRMHSRSSRRSNPKDEKLSFQNEISQKSSGTDHRRSTPNIRRATKPRESTFKMPSSAITRSQKTLNCTQKPRQTGDEKAANKSFENKQSPISRPTYAEEVLPYKQQKYGSPLVLPKHRVATSSNDGEKSDLESIITDLTDTYSVADSGVTWSDVLLKLPVRPRRSKSQRSKGRSRRHGEESSSSICSSQTQKSKRSFVVKYKDLQPNNKGKVEIIES